MSVDIYLRVSTHFDEAASTSLVDQKVACSDLAERKGLAVGIALSDEGVSGGTAVSERKLEQLIQRVEHGESEGVVAYSS